MPQLDSLRAVAVLAVLGSHWLPEYFAKVNWGYLGVVLFFVISGFLITGILLKEIDAAPDAQRRPFPILRRFYVRRTLRIFPLYYAAVLFAVAFAPAVRATWAWHFGYSVNLLQALTGEYVHPTVAFWSLGVEEQFYLVWPLVLLYTPRRWLGWIFALLAVTGPLSRVALALLGVNDLAIQFLPTSCLDSLAAGASLALLNHSEHAQASSVTRGIGAGALLGGFMLLVCALIPAGTAQATLVLTLGPAFATLVFAYAVQHAAKGVRGRLGAALEWAPALFIGRISYGIYVVHIFVPPVLRRTFAALGVSLDVFSTGMLALCYLVVTVALATISWFAFEAPINGLKDRFANPRIAVLRPDADRGAGA